MKLWSTGQIAERYGVRGHRVRYICRIHNIEPAAQIGRTPGFTFDAVEKIGKALAETPTRETPAKRDCPPEASYSSYNNEYRQIRTSP